MASNPRPALSPGIRMLVDFGPLFIFFLVNTVAPGPAIARGLAATAAFMVAISAAVAFSWWRTRHVSAMLWLSAVMVLVFGGLTLYFHNLNFIQAKPTIYYLLLSFALTYGLAADKPLLQALLGAAYPGLSTRGWRLLTISWAVFFAVMALLNTVVWFTQTFDFWAWFKIWVAIPLTVVFAMLNIPMLMRHGLQIEAPEEAPLPPEG